MRVTLVVGSQYGNDWERETQSKEIVVMQVTSLRIGIA